jgi:hypothetical protein
MVSFIRDRYVPPNRSWARAIPKSEEGAWTGVRDDSADSRDTFSTKYTELELDMKM